MTQLSSIAGTQEWLKATEDIAISASLDADEFILPIDDEVFTKEDFEQALEKVSQKVKK